MLNIDGNLVYNARSSPKPSVTTTTTTIASGGVVSSQSSTVTHHSSCNSSSSNDQKNLSMYSSSTTSPIVSRQLVMINSSDTLPSFDTIRSQVSSSTKDLQSSQTSIAKPTLILVPPTIKQIASNSANVILPKLANPAKVSNEKRTNHSTDDSLFVRYEREPSSANYDQLRFSFVIDEHTPSLHKRLRYVSINDL
jgi:hypothetical protein